MPLPRAAWRWSLHRNSAAWLSPAGARLRQVRGRGPAQRKGGCPHGAYCLPSGMCRYEFLCGLHAGHHPARVPARNRARRQIYPRAPACAPCVYRGICHKKRGHAPGGGAEASDACAEGRAGRPGPCRLGISGAKARLRGYAGGAALGQSGCAGRGKGRRTAARAGGRPFAGRRHAGLGGAPFTQGRALGAGRYAGCARACRSPDCGTGYGPAAAARMHAGGILGGPASLPAGEGGALCATWP